MLRRTLLAALTSLLLAAGLLTGGLTASPAGASERFDNSIGIIKVPNQPWRGRCARYTMRWRFTPPNDQWTVVARIRTPKGFSIRSEFWDADASGKFGQRSGRMRFPLCGSSVKPGRYKVEMQMIYNVTDRETVTKNRQPTYFRLYRRR